MGVVYEAFDRERGVAVALKTIKRTDARWLSRFKREFRALHDVVHPNLVSLGELFDGESEPFFTMELVRGVDFLSYVRGGGDSGEIAVNPVADTQAHVIDPAASERADGEEPGDRGKSPLRGPRAVESTPYDERRLRAALKQLAAGIGALHAAGMIHRDIKPSNTRVTADGRVVLLDFGLVAGAVGGPHTTDAAVVGTASYMAPEQAMSGEATPAVDWYSFGVVLFEALTGALPHTGRTTYEVIANKQANMAAPPRQFVEAVPPDLDDLCTRLLSIDPAARPSGREIFDRLGLDDNRSVSSDTSSLSSSLTSSAPFVGRSEELETLRDACKQHEEGPRIWLVEGVSGIGKSYLVAELLRRVSEDDPDAVVLTGRCYEREDIAYKALDGIIDSLVEYLRGLPDDQVAALMPVRAALLARLFPVMRQLEAVSMAPVVRDVPDPQDQRRRMFLALRELFLRLAIRRRLVWFIDDLQWTDADSLVLLQDLLSSEERLAVVLIANMRPADTPERKELVATIEAMAPTTRLRLAELAPEEARELATALLPGRDPSQHAALAAEAGGHPLFLHELARHAGGAEVEAASGTSLDDLLRRRIDSLASEPRTLLQIVALFGGPLEQGLAGLAANMSEANLAKAVRDLRFAHLVRTDGVHRTDRIVTYHDRVREHVNAGLEPDRVRFLHKRLALALEQSGAAERDPRALVRHARAAGRTGLAASYALTGARSAVNSHAFDQAAELFATALELGNHDEEALRGLRIELATALVHAGRGPEAAVQFMEAAEGAEPAVRLDCHRNAAHQWIVTGHLENGLGVLRTSLAEIGASLAQTPKRALARVVWNRLRIRLRGMGFEQRRESQIPLEDLRRLDVLKTAAHGLAMVDNIRGADFNSRFLLWALRTGEPTRLAQALGPEAIFLASQGGSAGERARKVYAKLLKLADAHPDNNYIRSWVLLADGGCRFFEGKFLAADEVLEKGEALLTDRTTGTTFERNNFRAFRVYTLRQAGALRKNGAIIAEAVAAARQRGDRYVETTLQFLRGRVLLAQGNLAAARDTVERTTWVPPGDSFHLQHWGELRSRAELALYEREAPAAVEELAPSFRQLYRSMLTRLRITCADAISLEARLLLASGRAGHAPDGAREEVARIARRLDRLHTGYADVFALLLRAGLGALDSNQSDEETVAFLRSAIDVAKQNDMALYEAAARDNLGRIVGGDEGAALCADAAKYVADEGIVDPERMFEIVAPGLRSS